MPESRSAVVKSQGHLGNAGLNPDVDYDEWESDRVRYLSPHFVDRLRSSAGLASELREEMERVVFDATDPTDRLETDSFEQLADAYLIPPRSRREELKQTIATTSNNIAREDELHTKRPQLKTKQSQLVAQIERDKRQQTHLIP